MSNRFPTLIHYHHHRLDQRTAVRTVSTIHFRESTVQSPSRVGQCHSGHCRLHARWETARLCLIDVMAVALRNEDLLASELTWPHRWATKMPKGKSIRHSILIGKSAVLIHSIQELKSQCYQPDTIRGAFNNNHVQSSSVSVLHDLWRLIIVVPSRRIMRVL